MESRRSTGISRTSHISFDFSALRYLAVISKECEYAGLFYVIVKVGGALESMMNHQGGFLFNPEGPVDEIFDCSGALAGFRDTDHGLLP